MNALSKSCVALSLTVTLLGIGMQAPAQAQPRQSGLVNVSLTNVNVLNDIANDLNINVSQIPVTVQVPVGVAANVCGVNAALLLAAIRDTAQTSCTALTNSQALNQFVQRQLVSQ